MKYLLSIFATLLVCLSFFSNISDVSAGGFFDIIFSGGGGNEIPYCNNGDDCGFLPGIDAIKPITGIETQKSASQYIQDVVQYVLGFLMLLSVIIIIYAGIVLLTGLGDEEKVKKTKNIILYAIFGLIIIFLAYPISKFVFDGLNAG